MIRLFNWFVKLTGYLPQRLVFRTKVHYEDAATQKRHIKGPAIIISNHTSVMDYAMLIFVFFTRTLRCQAAELQFNRPVMGWFLKLLGAIRVDRSFDDMSCVGKSEAILRKGGVVAIFPEGRLPLAQEKTPLPFRHGAAYLALHAGVPVIPVYSDGRYFAKGRAQVVIGKPINVRALYDESKSERENLQAISQAFAQKVYGLKEKIAEKPARKRAYGIAANLAYDFVKITAAIPALIWMRPKWVSVARESRRVRGPALVVSNHNSFFDPIALMVAVFYCRFRFVATEELFAGKFKNWLFGKVFRCIPIDRKNMRMQTFRQVNEALKSNEIVALFPEGHVLTDEQSQQGTMRSGMVLMAAQGKCPIVPVYMQTPAKWYHRLRIAIGEPIQVQTRGMMPTLEEINRITGDVASSMRSLREICYNDQYAQKNKGEEIPL
ncbi:MAG: 1-acyl-sn-glycerol-3-phosphate acyltransferase [Clostridiales bacterium]|nr:1-acyl-sn-glycerol-3-phosphate acyltransferase [Clostridiales bacterium]